MDPRDPRASGNDPPLRPPADTGWNADLPLVAPETEWEGRSFNREKFLLWFLAVAMICQYAFLFVGTIFCFNSGRYRVERGLPPLSTEQTASCRSIGDRLSTVFELSVSVVLALMVGSTAALGKGKGDPRRSGDRP